MKTELYTIKTLTNLHVGSGDINFDIVDNQVQRDFDGLPTIHSSSLKGALREHMGQSGQRAEYIFGPENNANSPHQTGAYSFFSAKLLTRPVRSNNRPYCNATTPQVISEFLESISDFSVQIDESLRAALEELASLEPSKGSPFVLEATDGVKLENFDAVGHTCSSIDHLRDLLGNAIALFHHDDYRKLTLPVLARNHLDNGKSINLWYEEVVPKNTKFYFVLGKPENIDPADKTTLEKFDNQFNEKLQEIIQIGANASVGYGYTRFEKVSL